MAFKQTNQRLAILEILRENKTHPTVDQVYDAVRKRLPRTSKATVYQNLKLFAEQGVIQEVNCKGVSRFEANTTPHHHIICKRCGDIIDFESKALTEYSLRLARKLQDIRVESAHTNFYGTCTRCQQFSTSHSRKER